MTAAAERLVSAIAEAMPGWGLEGTVVPGSIDEFERGWSYQVHFSISGDGGETRLIAKVPRWDGVVSLADAMSRGSQAATAQEFSVMEALHRAVVAAADPGLVAVRPVGYLADCNAVVTEVLDAVPLRDVVARSGDRVADRDLHAVFTRIGRWLRLFHEDLGSADEEAFPGAEIEAEVQGLEQRMQALGASAPGWAALAAFLHRAVGELDGAPCLVADLHGDFTPANVLVTRDGRVAVLDPNPTRGPIERDAAKLTVALATSRDQAVSQLAPWRRRRDTPPFDALFAGYGAGRSPATWPVAEGLALAHRWVELAERRAVSGRSVVDRIGFGIVVRGVRRRAADLIAGG